MNFIHGDGILVVIAFERERRELSFLELQMPTFRRIVLLKAGNDIKR